MPKPQRLPNIDEQTLRKEPQVRLALPGERTRWNKLVCQRHYLKNARLVGEQLRYVVTDARGTWLALIGWSAAAMHLKARDQSIEWSEQQREGRLHFLAQNSRWVILAKRQQFPNLASRAMSLCLNRLSEDWQQHYHHPIVMVESFVDRQYFQATAWTSKGRWCNWTACTPSMQRCIRSSMTKAPITASSSGTTNRPCSKPPSNSCRRTFPPLLEKTSYRGARKEYRAIVTRTIEPKELGLAGALQIARVDRRMGAKGELHQTWLVASRSKTQMDLKRWLELEQQRWGIENRTHYTLDVTHREDESRVRQPNAASVLGIFRRLSKALKQGWAKGRPKREATSRDWIEENQCNRWNGIRLLMRPIPI
jgi:predicted transposase YbfD/YdcC